LPDLSRRKFVEACAIGSAASLVPNLSTPLRSVSRLVAGEAPRFEPLQEFGYGDVSLSSPIHEAQLHQTHSVLMEMSDDALLKPFRAMIGQPAPGEDLGGWYTYYPNYDWHTFDAGFAPSATFGQWVSALARYSAITGSQPAREKVLRLNRLYAQVIAGEFYQNNRFPAYCYDKLVCGLIDSHQYVGDPDAFAILQKTTDAALPHLPEKAVEHGTSWRPGKDESWTWDESYTIPENLFLAYQRGAGDRYRAIAQQYLNEPFFDRVANGENDFAGRHAYSHVNCLCSAMQAYLTLGSEKHLRAAKDGFDMLRAQSFVTGGWGPDEQLRGTDSSDVFDSLTKTHSSFETPCGSYAHFKLTRYLLRVTRDSSYGDSMERMMYNTILGAKPLQADGHTFYYSDYNFAGRKVYSRHRWPCCSGTMPQVAADYRISTYLRDARAVYVNLYIPSTLRWTQDGTQVSLTQESDYPFSSHVQFAIRVSKPVEFAVKLRIPAWAGKASVKVNGNQHLAAQAGTFASVQRRWKDGDRIELEITLTTRLEPIDRHHTDTLALMNGPLVLFAVTNSMPRVSRAQLLAARQAGRQKWQVDAAGGTLLFLPFTGLGDEQYSTYIRVS
jgi:uncharacterized protein